MMAQKYGRIILTTSAAGLYGDGTGPEFNPKQAYATAKMALVGMTKALAMRGRPADINANALSPTGRHPAGRAEQGHHEHPRAGAPPPEATSTGWPNTPLRRRWRLVRRGSFMTSCRVRPDVCWPSAPAGSPRSFIGVTEGYINPDITPEDVRDNVKEVFDQDRSSCRWT